jgi:acyl-homoserine-lactone acylase
MRLSRRHLVLAAVATCALTVAACSSDDSDGGADTTAAGASTAAPAATGAPSDTADVADGRYQATIRRTGDGVPHILAGDVASVSFGQGWASAEDHACSLADQILKVQGRRAEALGAGTDDANVKSDLAWRSIGIDAIAREDYPNASDTVREQFDAFAAGWSAAVESMGVDNLNGWCAGADWVTPLEGIDIYAYARSIALTAGSAQLARYIPTAQPPAAAPPTTESADGPIVPEVPVASNGWAIGAERSTGGGGMLVANPHFPWEGELRFWESHLTVPGELDVYGAQLLGLPGIGIGFTEGVAWTHTVSAGKRFTAYRLDLVPGDPTSYLVDGEAVAMTPQEVTIKVRADDGTMSERTQTMWHSEYGPILDFPGVGWTDALVITYRDANIDNDEFIEQYSAMDRAKTLDDLIAAHEEYQAVPLFNTIATSADGRAWYADISATPNLTDEAEAAYLESVNTDPLVQLAKGSGVVLLNGSDSRFRWEEQDGARDPGLVPYAELPQLERADYVFNANDSFWLANPNELLEGDYSVLHGERRTARSPRTRENATVLDDTSPSGPAGEDGTFTLDELAAAAVQNTGYTSRALRDEVVARCDGVTTVDAPALTKSDGSEALPATTIDVSEACDVLAAWDLRYDLDSVGAALWRELISPYSPTELTTAGALWAQPFDPADPVGTPRGLAPAPAGAADPLLVNLARAVQILQTAGYTPSTPLGEIQFTERSGERIPIHGGFGDDGVTNIVSWSVFTSTTEVLPTRSDPLTPTSTLTANGYPINYGSSFMMAIDFSSGQPVAKVFLTYGNTGDRESPLLDEATRAFSEKAWRSARFTDDDITADPDVVITGVSGD